MLAYNISCYIKLFREEGQGEKSTYTFSNRFSAPHQHFGLQLTDSADVESEALQATIDPADTNPERKAPPQVEWRMTFFSSHRGE